MFLLDENGLTEQQFLKQYDPGDFPRLEETVDQAASWELVEETGIGMGSSNPDVENPMKWRGQNLLGFALTQVRDELINQLEE